MAYAFEANYESAGCSSDRLEAYLDKTAVRGISKVYPPGSIGGGPHRPRKTIATGSSKQSINTRNSSFYHIYSHLNLRVVSTFHYPIAH
jgi:hypothetical protein